MEATDSRSVERGQLGRWPKHAVWIGTIITLFGVLSYYLYFIRFPDLRDVPLVNVPLSLFGLILCGAGSWHVLTRGRRTLGKVLAVVLFLLTFGVAGLFNGYVFVFSYRLPDPATATSAHEVGPDFALLDHNRRPVSLADYRGRKVVLVFYRGFW